MHTHTDPAPRLSVADRLLRVFSDVRAGEAGTALLMLANVFLLLVAYYIIKTVREPLILATGGAELKSFAAAGQAVTLMVFIPLYSLLASRVDRVRLIVSLVAFFVVCIELFYAFGRAGVPMLGFAFFIWVGIFNLATVAQFWGFANDIYAKEAGDRLFPVIAIGATAGSWVGSRIAKALFDARIDPFSMLQLTVVLLLLHLALYLVVDRRTKRAADPSAGAALIGRGGFSLVFNSRYLTLIALLLVLLNFVNTTGEYLLDRYLVVAAQQAVAADPTLTVESFIGSFKGSYFSWVNILALLLQALVASRLVKYAGLTGVLLMLPVVALGSYALIGAGVGLALVRWAKTAENATDYSIMNTAKQLLWLPTTREQKYKAKQAVDTFFVRTGDVLSAGLVWLGTQVLHLGVPAFAWINLAVTAVWLALGVMLLRQHRALTAAAAR